MTEFAVTATPLAGVMCLERQRRGDVRGFLERLFCADALAALDWRVPVAQVNRTLTQHAGTIRGMHLQHAPSAEMKLVSCVRGAVFDVALDLRAASPTFGQWHSEMLSEENGRMMLIPEGCAHGFQALTDDAELVYVHSAAYRPEHEGGVHALDTALAIAWPLACTDMSARDQSLPSAVAFRAALRQVAECAP